MCTCVPFCWLAILTALAVVPGDASCGAIPDLPVSRPGPLESRLLADARDGRWDEFSLFEAALVASGIEREDELARRRLQFASICDGFAEAILADKPSDRVKAAFELMHGQILTGEYRAQGIDFVRTLDDGDFNCVTATILFHCLCESFGVAPQAMATPGHVFSRFVGGHLGDVEATCPRWFAAVAGPPSRRDARAGQGTAARPISPVQLIGKVYYNAGGARLATGGFAAAVKALWISVQLDPQDVAAQENLLAAVNNWSLAESDSGQFQQAAALLSCGMRMAPQYAAFLANDLHVHQKWALALCRSGNFPQALEILEHGYRRRPDAELFDLGRFAVVSQWAESLLADGRFEEAWQVFGDAGDRYPQRPELLRYEETAVRRSLQALLAQGRRDEAMRLSKMAAERGLPSE